MLQSKAPDREECELGSIGFICTTKALCRNLLILLAVGNLLSAADQSCAILLGSMSAQGAPRFS